MSGNLGRQEYFIVAMVSRSDVVEYFVGFDFTRGVWGKR